LTLDVANNSDKEAQEVVQVYISKTDRSATDPNCSLKAFQRITVPANSKRRVSFTLDDKAFSSYDATGNLQLEKGNYNITCSSGTPIRRTLELGAPKWQSVNVSVSSK